MAASVCVVDGSLGFSHRFPISTVPSVVPKRVRTRIVSAVQIEVIWEALPALPERVLGYEVSFASQSNFFYFSLH